MKPFLSAIFSVRVNQVHTNRQPCTAESEEVSGYRGTSLIRKRKLLGPYRRPMARVVEGSQGVGLFLMSEVPLYFGRIKSCFKVLKVRPLEKKVQGPTLLAWLLLLITC